jgi:hypothetical protein
MSRFYGHDKIVYTSEHYSVNQRFSSCSPAMDVGFVKLMLDSFSGNRVFKMNTHFCHPVTCAAIDLRFFETVLFSVP